MLTRGFAWKKIKRIVLCGLLIALAGCATAVTDRPKLVELMWPEPPEVARVKFIQTVASERDLGRETTFGEDLLSILLGQKPPVWHLYEPVAIAVSDDSSRLYVSDFGQRLIYVFDLKEKKVKVIGEEQAVGRPFGIALDGEENVYVADQQGKIVRVFDRAARPLRTIGDGNLMRPTGIAIDRQRGRIYVADSAWDKDHQNFVKIFDMQGRFLGNVGEGKDGGDYRYFPTYLAVDGDGNLYITDTMNARVIVFDPQGNYLKKFGQAGDSWGSFSKPKGVALDTFGNVYVVDSAWSNAQIFNRRGEILLFFGGRSRYPGLMQNPTGIAIDRNNRIYVADTFNFRVNVYQLVNTTTEDSNLTPPDAGEKGGKTAAESSAPNIKRKGGEGTTLAVGNK